MKLKQIPADFRVEEIATIVRGEGPFALYRLEKVNWTTPDALNIVRRRWNIPFSRLSYGGLKDRHAKTSQYLTIFHGPKRNFTHSGIAVEYVGQREGPFTSTDIEANRFILVLRSMSSKAIGNAQISLVELKRIGVPNYFDDQRFGSVGPDGRFVAKEMVLGRFEQAMKTALLAPYEHDRTATKQEKSLLREAWGDWPRLKAELPKGPARILVDYLLHHPTDFRGALERLKPELRGLYLSAWQSHLWNKMLAQWLRDHVSPGQMMSMRSRLADLPVPRTMRAELLDEWRSLTIPLPSARLKLDPAAPWAPIVEEVMKDEGLKLEEMKLKAFRKPFFSKGDRAAAVIPTDLSVEADEDELNPGKQKLILRFDLPRGCYATMIVKRLTQMKEG
jgi:tRNA pseudouridine13 synthase